MAKRPAVKKAAARKPAGRTTTSRSKATSTRARATAIRERIAPAKRAGRAKGAAPAKRVAAASAPLFGPLKGAQRRNIGHVQLDVGRAGAARVKRMIYPPGFHWEVDMKPVTGTDRCMHAHVG